MYILIEYNIHVYSKYVLLTCEMLQMKICISNIIYGHHVPPTCSFRYYISPQLNNNTPYHFVAHLDVKVDLWIGFGFLWCCLCSLKQKVIK